MTTDSDGRVRTFILVPEKDLGHALARRLRRDSRVEVVGVSVDPDQDAYRIFEAAPDVVLADVDVGGLDFLTKVRLPPGKHRVVFFAPRSEAGCDACYEALVNGAQGVMCRPASGAEITNGADLVRSIRDGTLMRPDDCPAVQRLRREERAGRDD